MNKRLFSLLHWVSNHKKTALFIVAVLVLALVSFSFCSCKSYRTYSVTRVYTATNTPPKSVVIEQGGQKVYFLPCKTTQARP